MSELKDDVAEYLHWRKVNPHIKGGENYLKRMRESLDTYQPHTRAIEKIEAHRSSIIKRADLTDTFTVRSALATIDEVLAILKGE